VGAVRATESKKAYNRREVMQLILKAELRTDSEEKISEYQSLVNFTDLADLQRIRREGIMIAPPYLVGDPEPPAVPVPLSDTLDKMLDCLERRLSI
jgi:hypothetical protein